MSAEPDDSRLRQEFQRLRREDEAQAPAFRFPTADPPPSRSPSRRPPAGPAPWRRGWAAALLVLSMAAVAGLVRWRDPETAPPPHETAALSLSLWHAPTDSLLRAPADRLLRTVPRVDESLLGGRFSIGGQKR